MSLTDRIPRRPSGGGSAPPPSPSPVNAPTVGVAEAPPPVQNGPASEDLRARRDVVARRFVELQWDLGGVVYEMASRDHFRLDVLTKQAAELQEIDAELAGIERMLRLEEAGAAGTCPSCGALFARGAAFCWSCGTTLIEPVEPTGAPVPEVGR